LRMCIISPRRSWLFVEATPSNLKNCIGCPDLSPRISSKNG
jgi:hypothetical protein